MVGWLSALLQLVGTALLLVGFLLRLRDRGRLHVLWSAPIRAIRRLLSRLPFGQAPPAESREDWDQGTTIEELRVQVEALEGLREPGAADKNAMQKNLRSLERQVDDVAVGHAGLEAFGLVLLLAGLALDLAQLVGWL